MGFQCRGLHDIASFRDRRRDAITIIDWRFMRTGSHVFVAAAGEPIAYGNDQEGHDDERGIVHLQDTGSQVSMLFSQKRNRQPSAKLCRKCCDIGLKECRGVAEESFRPETRGEIRKKKKNSLLHSLVSRAS